ncbi:MAG: hypothetical protein ACF8R7_07445 [Phycisphaerales bacterium JB039]
MRPAVLIIWLLAAAAALAEPFNPGHVAASARWVAHLDVDRIREADGLQRMLAGAGDAAARDKARAMLQRMGVDPKDLEATDFSFICAYGAGAADQAVAIIGGNQAMVDWFIDWMSAAGEAQPPIDRHDHTIRTWLHQGELTAMLTASLDGGRTAMILASSADEVIAAARVLADQSPSLADVETAIIDARPAPGAILFIAARDMQTYAAVQPRAVALRETTDLTIQAGESAGALFFSAELVTTGPEQASALRDMLNGMRAWARLASRNWPRAETLGSMFDAIQMRIDDSRLHISWQAEIDTLLPSSPDEAPPP